MFIIVVGEGVGYFLCLFFLNEVLGGFVEGFGQFG